MKMKLLLVGCMLCCCIPTLLLSQQPLAFNKTNKISGNKEDTNITIKEALLKIREVFDVDILFDNETVHGLFTQSALANTRFASAEKALQQILKGHPLEYKKMKKDAFIILAAKPNKAVSKNKAVTKNNVADDFTESNRLIAGERSKQLADNSVSYQRVSYAAGEIVVTGRVTNDQSAPVARTSITVKGTNRGTSTDDNGRFSINISNEKEILVFSAVGYEEQQIMAGRKTVINVILKSSAGVLADVVVIGYGSVKKSDLTGAVATVKGEQLIQVATVDPVQAMQGRIAGVEITSNSGQPGSGTRIRIRGVGTINNSNPLYVVDGFQTGNINFLMPGDIESIEILKDASATAIYGSRGANGVVLVTTKKGKIGKPRFSFNGYVGVQQIWRKLDLADAAGYATLVTEAYKNEGQAVPANISDRLQNAIATKATGTDWQDEVTQNGMISNYNLSVSGGTEQNRYLISGGYFQQDGTVKNTGLKKYVIRLNDELVLTKNIKAGISANFTRSGNYGYNNLTRGAVLANPVSTPFTSAGEYAYNDIENALNVVRIIEDQGFNKTENNNLLTNAYLDFKLTRGLSVRSDFGINYNNAHGKPYLPQYFIGLNDQRSVSSLTENRTESVGWVWANYINYNTTFAKDHSLSATLGQESQRSYSNGISINAFDVPRDALLQYVSASRSITSNFSSSQQDESLLSFFGRANYDYKNRYLLTATLRYDGSSKFLNDVRWGMFPSFGAAWRISNENFLRDVKAISSLKLRAGWGQVGNQNAAPNYAYVSTARNNMNYVFNNVIVPGMIPNQISNPNLKWETAISSNIGLDADLFNNRLSVTADYFIKKTKDMIALLPVADYIGAAPPSANVASMQNKGLELAVNYRNTINKFRYDVGVNFTKINNKVTDLGGASPIASGNVISQMGNTTLTDIGYEIAYFYGLKSNGIFKSQDEINGYKNSSGTLVQPNAKPGDVRFADLSNDGKISSLDRTYLGSASNPDFSYGVSANLGYNNFDFRVLFYGVSGAEAVNGLSRYLLKTSNSTGSWNSFYASRLNRWTPSNPNTNEPRVTTRDLNGNDQFSDRFVENASYLRARNIEMGYTFPKSILSRYKINGLRFNLSVDNLFTITKYTGFDPEISETGNFGDPLSYGVDFGNYPQPRTYRVGLNLQF